MKTSHPRFHETRGLIPPPSMCHLLDTIATNLLVNVLAGPLAAAVATVCSTKFVKRIHQQPKSFCMNFFPNARSFSFKTVWTSSNDGAMTTRGSPSNSKTIPMQQRPTRQVLFLSPPTIAQDCSQNGMPQGTGLLSNLMLSPCQGFT
jgi:hypothetical protein